MKKLFALVLALVMALSLVACGDKKDDSGDVTVEHTDTTTVAVGAVILARDDVSSDDVYKFVADIFDNAASLTTSHAKYGELSLEYGASITSVPYHPGAAKYFSEKGFEVAAVKDGAGNTESRNLRFVTGGESGTYYAFGSVIAQHATNNAGINVVGLVGNGSQANVQELVDGTADFAFCQSDVMAYAYNGTNLFESKVEGFSTVAALYMEQVQIVTTNPAIKTVADLAGKSVSIGAPGSGVYFNAIDRRRLHRGRRPHHRCDRPGHHQGYLSGEPGQRAHRQAAGDLRLLHRDGHCQGRVLRRLILNGQLTKTEATAGLPAVRSCASMTANPPPACGRARPS